MNGLKYGLTIQNYWIALLKGDRGLELTTAIPPNALRVTHLEAGAFARPLNGSMHSKTCPHAIWAQAQVGRYEIACGDGRYCNLREGEAFLVPAHLPLRITHYGSPRRGYRMQVRWLHLQFTLYDSIDVVALLDLPLRVPRQHCAALGCIAKELLAQSPSGAGGIVDLAQRQALGWEALAHLAALGSLRPGAGVMLQHQARFKPVVDYMDAHLAERLTVSRLAGEANLSVPQFHALFRKAFGTAPMKYLKNRRLAVACRLLSETALPLSEIASQTGFCNAFHLSRDFRRAFGKPPGRWRREYDQQLV